MKRYREELVANKENLESRITYWENQIPLIHMWTYLLGGAIILALLLCGGSQVMQEYEVVQFLIPLIEFLILMFAIFLFLLKFLPKRIEQLEQELHKVKTELNKY